MHVGNSFRVYTSSTITPSTTSTYINVLDPMIANNESYLIFNNDTLSFTDVMMIKPDDVKTELIQYCEIQLLQLTTSTDSEGFVPPSPGPIPQHSLAPIFNTLNKDHLTSINQIYIDIFECHTQNQFSNDDIDSDIITLLGLLQVTDIDNLHEQAVVMFLRSLYTLNKK